MPRHRQLPVLYNGVCKPKAGQRLGHPTGAACTMTSKLPTPPTWAAPDSHHASAFQCLLGILCTKTQRGGKHNSKFRATSRTELWRGGGEMWTCRGGSGGVCVWVRCASGCQTSQRRGMGEMALGAHPVKPTECITIRCLQRTYFCLRHQSIVQGNLLTKGTQTHTHPCTAASVWGGQSKVHA